MSFGNGNVVVRGLNAAFRYIGRGFARPYAWGIKVDFCRVSVDKSIRMKISVN